MFFMKSILQKKVLTDVVYLIVLIIVDLVSKYLFYNQWIGKNSFWLEPAINMGVSFSFNVSYLLVIPLSLFVLVWFFYLYRYKSFPHISTILLAAWTVGNLYDRIVYDGVRDFLVMPQWFIFNIADVFLSTGMIIAFLYVFFSKTK